MKVIIFAVDLDGNFGQFDGSLPWDSHNTEDMKHFRGVTKELRNVVMGYKTYETLPNGLPNRFCFVPSRSVPNLSTSDNPLVFIQDQEEFEKTDGILSAIGIKDYSLIGGWSLIQKALQSTVTFDKIYVTFFKKRNPPADIQVDTSFLGKFERNVVFEDNEIKIIEYLP